MKTPYTYHSRSFIFIAPKSVPRVSCHRVKINKAAKGKKRRMGYVSAAIDLRRDRLSPRGLTKTIMYKGVRENYRSTPRNNGFGYDVTNDRLLIGHGGGATSRSAFRDRGNRSFWRNTICLCCPRYSCVLSLLQKLHKFSLPHTLKIVG